MSSQADQLQPYLDAPSKILFRYQCFVEYCSIFNTYEGIIIWCNLVVGLECISQSLETIVGIRAVFGIVYIYHPYRQYTVVLLARLAASRSKSTSTFARAQNMHARIRLVSEILVRLVGGKQPFLRPRLGGFSSGSVIRLLSLGSGDGHLIIGTAVFRELVAPPRPGVFGFLGLLSEELACEMASEGTKEFGKPRCAVVESFPGCGALKYIRS